MSKKVVGVIIGVVIAAIIIGAIVALTWHKAAPAKTTVTVPTKKTTTAPPPNVTLLKRKEHMVFGTLMPWTVEWNPWNIAVNAWIYDYIVLSPTNGIPIIRNPITGDVEPFQCKFKVIRGPLKINGYMWNDTLKKWVKVNGTALNAVIFNCKLGVWQDNQTETLWDIIYEYYRNWEWCHKAGKNDKLYDAAYASAVCPSFLPIIKAINVINKTAFIVYVNYTHPYAGKIVANAIYWPQLPWPEVYAIEKLVEEGKVAVTEQTAKSENLPCIDLKAPDTSSYCLSCELKKLAEEGAIPPAIANAPAAWKKILGTITPKEASKYYMLAYDFIKAHGHAWIGDGYYMIDRIYISERALILKVWPKYPIHGKAFDYILRDVLGLNVTPVPDDVWKYKTLVIKQVGRDVAPEEVIHGILTGYLWNINPSVAIQLIQKGYRDYLKVYPLGNGYVDLLFNPAPPDKEAKAHGIYCNPFEYPEVRFAFNYLIDRNWIRTNIYYGYAIPMYFPGIPPQYRADYEILAPIITQLKLGYNPQYGKELIFETLKKHGYIYKNGHWYCPPNATGGKLVPVTIIVARRVEDQRYEIGAYVEHILEELGFKVVDKKITGREAYKMVYGSNPADMEWMVYTEGWIDTEMIKYHDDYPYAYCAMYALMPGWGVPGWWQYNASKVYVPPMHMNLYQLTYDLSLGKFKTLKQRAEMFYWAVYYCLKQAVRVWIAAVNGIYVVNPSVKGLVPNNFGFWHTLNMMHIYVAPT